MQLLTTKKKESLDPLRNNKKTKMSPINLLKYKKNSENCKNKNQSPNKKQQIKLTAITNNLELQKLMLCGGMKLNTRFNSSVEKRKKVVGTLKTIRIINPQKIELGSNTTPNYFVNFAPSPVSLAKRSKILQNLYQSKATPSLPLIDSKDIIISKQSYSNKTDNFYAFSQTLKYYVSLYKYQNNNNTIILHPNILSTYGLCTLSTNQEKYYVTDMFEGSTLRNLVVQFGSLHQITTKIYIRQLVKGICKMHSLGLVHNRLNMDTILHDKMGNILINCFRSSKLPLSESQKSVYLYFFPPQTILSQNYYNSQKNDVWAIGCITLQILIAKPLKFNKYHPYNNHIQNDNQTQQNMILSKIQKIIQQKNIVPPATNFNIELNHQISTSALQFIQKCLSIKIQHRPTINQLITHPFLVDQPNAYSQQ